MKYERKKVPPEELLRTVEIYSRTGSLHATARALGIMNLIVHSKTHGEVLRARCDVGMIQ